MAVSFDFIKRLGSGHFGEVWLVNDTGLDTECALKCIPPNKVINKDNFFQEAQILKSAEHNNVIEVKETGMLGDGRIYVAMEYLKKGSIEDEAKGAYIPLTRAKRIMIDTLRGLDHAHAKGIVHRDIKPGNILIANNGEAKLSDFGLALPNIGTLDFSSIKGYQYILHLAPEVSTFVDHTPLSDIYACGVTLYRLINGDSYIPSLPPSEIHDLAVRGLFPDRDKYRDFIPKQIRNIINKSIEIDSSRRFKSANEMRHALEQVNLIVNWQEKILSNGMYWISRTESFCYEIKKTNAGKLWNIDVKKGRSKSHLRKMNDLCKRNINKSQADKIAKRILQDFVLEKIK